jgi:hypothetical protein
MLKRLSAKSKVQEFDMRKTVVFLLAATALVAAADIALAKQKPTTRHSCPTITHYFSWFTTYSDVCILDEGEVDWTKGSHDHQQQGGKKPPA